MSIEFQVTEILPGTTERAFQALTDLEDAANWMPGYVAIERVGDVRQGVGMRWRETRKMRGKEVTEEFEVTHYHPPSHLGIRMDGAKGSTRGGTFDLDYKLAQRVGGAEVRMTGRIDRLPLMLRLLSPVLGPVLRRECARDLHALAEHLRHAEHAQTAAAAS